MRSPLDIHVTDLTMFPVDTLKSGVFLGPGTETYRMDDLSGPLTFENSIGESVTIRNCSTPPPWIPVMERMPSKSADTTFLFACSFHSRMLSAFAFFNAARLSAARFFASEARTFACRTLSDFAFFNAARLSLFDFFSSALFSADNFCRLQDFALTLGRAMTKFFWFERLTGFRSFWTDSPTRNSNFRRGTWNEASVKTRTARSPDVSPSSSDVP